MKFLLRLFVSPVVIFCVAYFSGGSLLRVDSIRAAVCAAVVLAVVNALVKPVVKLFALPLTVMTLGLFSLVVNALFLYLVDAVVPGFDTVGFLPTVAAALVISIATGLLRRLVSWV